VGIGFQNILSFLENVAKEGNNEDSFEMDDSLLGNINSLFSGLFHYGGTRINCSIHAPDNE
jgi:hypothetical protein